MIVTRCSPMTGKVNSMDLDVTVEQMSDWKDQGMLIQDAMPQLSLDEREFVKTGYTAEDWARMFPPVQGE